MAIYLVEELGVDKAYLVQADSRAQAVRHVTRARFKVGVANAATVAQYMGSGVKLERAKEGGDDGAR